jgi:hypothetical protein
VVSERGQSGQVAPEEHWWARAIAKRLRILILMLLDLSEAACRRPIL